MPKKILVTGGCGFIGSNFIIYWLKNHPLDIVINLDKITYAGNKKYLSEITKNKDCKKRYKFFKGNIRNVKLVQRILNKENPDIIVHFAAETHVTRSEGAAENAKRFFDTNVAGTFILLESCVQLNKHLRFIQISTDEVYGEVKDGFRKESEKKSGFGKATSPYAKTKAIADDLALSYSDKLDVIVARPTNNFGPRQNPEKLLPRSITNLFLGKPIEIWGEGNEIRDWLYVEDTARAIETLIEKGKTGEAYNIGANNKPEITNKEIAELLVEIMNLNKEKMIKFVPNPRKHHDFRYGVDTEKIKKLGWVPSYNIKELFTKTIDWYKNNKKIWLSLKKEAEKLYND